MREFDTISREFDSYLISNIDATTFQNNSELVSSFNAILETSKSIQNNSHDKNLIYHVNRSTKEKRLCISSDCVSDIMTIAHDHDQEHSKFEICFETISRFWYIRRLIKTLRSYIKHCSQCLQI